jgi:uncharacterized protein Smg (DUF494 family)
MHERIVEIILFLVNELKSNKQLSEVDVSLLSQNGYTQSEISTAFSWLFERLSIEAEKMVIHGEAFGYLLQCHELGLLNNSDIETIVERIMAAGFSSVGINEMKSFVAGLLFGFDNPSGGSGNIVLGNNDTIH